MTDGFQLDELDLMILSILSEDARSSLKEIANRCGLTSSAVLRRIKRLKQEGVIAGTNFIVDSKIFGVTHFATLLIDAKDSLEPQIKQKIRTMKTVIVCAESIGRYNLCALIIGHNIEDLKNSTLLIRNLEGINRVAVNIWTQKPYYDYSKTLKQIEMVKGDDNERS